MNIKFNYLLLIAFSAFFNLKAFSQAVGTPYIVPSINIVQFNYTGAIQQWYVPEGVTEIFVEVVGAQGGDFNSTDRQGGAGGKVQCRLVVVPNTTLYITVGGKPLNTDIQTPRYGFGGAGGNTQYAGRLGAAGGGLSAISTAQPIAHSNVLVVAAGGGGATGGVNTNVGGAAGGLTGSWGGTNNWTLAGGPGSPTTGGNAGTSGDANTTNPTSGAALSGGNGGIATNAASNGWNGGGGGGAGYFGGGGGRAGGDSQGAGGGGSSWATSSATGVLNISNFNKGNGFVLIRY